MDILGDASSLPISLSAISYLRTVPVYPESTGRGGGGGGTGDKEHGGAIVPVDFGQLASVAGLRW